MTSAEAVLGRVDPDHRAKLLKQYDKIIPKYDELKEWLKELIADVKAQEIAVNSVKSGGAALGVFGFIALFTPFPLLGVAALVGSGVTGVATTVGDLIATKVKGGNLSEKVDSIRKERLEFEKLMKKVEQDAELLQKELKVSKELALLSLLRDVPKAAAQAGVTQVINGGVDLAKLLPHLNKARTAVQAVKVVRIASVGQGTRITAVGVRNVVGAATPLAITTAAKVLGGLGAAFSVGDAIYSWATKNPTRKSAEALLRDVEKEVEKMKNNRKYLSNLV